MDDHAYDINTFCCECRECSNRENKKNKSKRCQGTFSVHYDGVVGEGSMQYNQCDSTIPVDGEDFCQHCKGQTETYQQLRDRLKAKEKSEFGKFKQAYEQAQNY